MESFFVIIPLKRSIPLSAIFASDLLKLLSRLLLVHSSCRTLVKSSVPNNDDRSMNQPLSCCDLKSPNFYAPFEHTQGPMGLTHEPHLLRKSCTGNPLSGIGTAS